MGRGRGQTAAITTAVAARGVDGASVSRRDMIDQRIQVIETETETQEVVDAIQQGVDLVAPHLLEMLHEIRERRGTFPTFEHAGATYTVYDAALAKLDKRWRPKDLGTVLACERAISPARLDASRTSGHMRTLLLLQELPGGRPKGTFCWWSSGAGTGLSCNESENLQLAPPGVLISFSEQCEGIFDQLVDNSQAKLAEASSGLQALTRLQESISYS